MDLTSLCSIIAHVSHLSVLLLLFGELASCPRNPALPGFNPDLSIIRVNDTYYLATSTFEFYPGAPIQSHPNLVVDWEVVSHAFNSPLIALLYGVPTGAVFYLINMSRWVLWCLCYDNYDPNARVFPPSDPTWTEPWGIDPDIFLDERTNKTILTWSGVNNNVERIYGIYQCEFASINGKCHGTDDFHRATIARSKSFQVQSTSHADLVSTPSGEWFTDFLGRRNINGSSPLGRETFLAPVAWVDGWPLVNSGGPVTLNPKVAPLPDRSALPPTFLNTFNSTSLRSDYYQIRIPYMKDYEVTGGFGGLPALKLNPNIYTLSNRDVPAALIRKQKSLNMTLSAKVTRMKPLKSLLQEIGIGIYLSEFQHQDIAIKKCPGNITVSDTCIYTQITRNTTITLAATLLLYEPIPSNNAGVILHIRAQPLTYQLGYSLEGRNQISWITSVESKWAAFAPVNYFVFTGAQFAIYATGNGFPWPWDGGDVRFD
ncbi:Arabinanase/levansucrase/invertase [Choiromyces venosus 120613-1]|uniref:Arabinanase/levansucrase/invertase n=1 Tax=Choiromyces venosus 120613-1 TaxID=1336337 RepID=A0A3N4IZY2_9PEZI|nr:Arabinanase/levansucrase/invertase [Choiromyces venosus 120613-1]